MGSLVMNRHRRSVYRVAAVPLLVVAGLSGAAAEKTKGDSSVDVAALASTIDLDPKLSRCTVSKERKGKGLENLLKVLKDGKPPAIARAVYRWKQQRIAGETRKTPQFIFGSKTGSDKEPKIAIMSDEYDSVSWGPAFDEKGGKRLYETLGKAVDCKCDTPLKGKLDPMVTGLREALEVTGKDELVSWGQKFTAHELASVAQHVIATQETQEGEISDGVKLEVGLQTYTTRQLFAYMHPVYDPDKNALSCDKLEDSLPVATEYQLYVALTGLQEGEEAELAEAFDTDSGQIAQGDADLSEEGIMEDDVDVTEEDGLGTDEEHDVAALDTEGSPDGDEVASAVEDELSLNEGKDYSAEDVADAAEEARGVEADEPYYESETASVSSSSRGSSSRRSRDDYVEEPYETVDYDPVEVVEDVDGYVDDWYRYPGYYDDFDYVEVYYEPLPPPIFIRPPVLTPVVSIFGGAVVFAVVTRPRWAARPWWARPRVLAARNVNINVNFFRPNRPRRFRPGWGLMQNRGFVRRKPRNFGRARLVPAKARLRNAARPGLKGKKGFWKAKRKKAKAKAIKRRNNATKRAIARKKALQKTGAKNKRKGIKNAAKARKSAAARRAALAKKKAAKKASLAKNRKAARNKATAKNKAAAARKRAAAKKAAAKTSRKKNAAAKKRTSRKAALAKQKSAASKKKAARKAASAKRKSSAAAAKKAAAKRRANAARKKAPARKAQTKRASKRKATARTSARRKAKARNASRKRAARQQKQRRVRQQKPRKRVQAQRRTNKNRKCPPGKRGKGCR